jgi:hypothetical protein
LRKNLENFPVAYVELDQETSMHGQNVQDEFQLQVNRMRNSLNALTLKNFMFDEIDNQTEKFVVVEGGMGPEAVKPFAAVPFKRSLSKHRQDTGRIQSHLIDPNDVIAALTASQEKMNEDQPKAARVQFAEESKQKPKLLLKDSSRDSDEVASITDELPWHKKHQYRTVTPFFKQQNKSKAVSSENVSLNTAFRPIEASRSTEDIQEILKPVPMFASKSFQELPTSFEFKRFDHFQTKSSDDLLMKNIDGVRKAESKRHKLMRIRSTSSTNLNRSSDELVYENFHYEIPEAPMSADVIIRKAPLPLPRTRDDGGNNSEKCNSKTIVYVLDKERDEFVLESPPMEPNIFNQAYEDVLLRNNVTRDSDATFFYSLVDSREDCEFK